MHVYTHPHLLHSEYLYCKTEAHVFANTAFFSCRLELKGLFDPSMWQDWRSMIPQILKLSRAIVHMNTPQVHYLTLSLTLRTQIIFTKQLQATFQRFPIRVPFQTKLKWGFLEYMSQLASQQQSLPPRSLVLAHWNSGKDADAGFFAGMVDRGQIWGFSRLPLLWATNIDTEEEIEEKKGEEFLLPPLPWAFVPRESQLTWVSQWWGVINKCIGLIINDSLNEDRYHPLKAWWFHEPDLTSHVVVFISLSYLSSNSLFWLFLN